MLDKVLEMRYNNQPELKEIKMNLLTRQIHYKEILDQDKRTQDNDLLNDIDKYRWDRQIRHPLLNQKKIKDAHVVVFGCGGIGSNVLIGLVYSGVHNFELIDYDKIEISNLNRQTLYIPEDINETKVEKAKIRLLNINPNINIKSHNFELNYPVDSNLLRINESNYTKTIKKVNELIKGADYIVNAVDYKGAQYLINDLCIKNKKPYYWGVVNHFLGEIFSYHPYKKGACLRCIFSSENLLNKNQFLRYKTKENSIAGVNLGSTVITTGSLISELIIHDICGINNPFHGNYCIYDAYNFQFIKVPIIINLDCECQKNIQT